MLIVQGELCLISTDKISVFGEHTSSLRLQRDFAAARGSPPYDKEFFASSGSPMVDAQSSNFSKYSFSAPHSGQHQSSGKSSKGVPGGILRS